MGSVKLPSGLPRLKPDAVERGVELEVPHPVTGEPTGFFVVVRAADAWSRPFKRHMRSAVERALTKLQANGENPDAETTDLGFADDIEFIVDALVGDMRPIYEDDEEVPFTRERGIELLSDPENAWLKEWVVRQAQLYWRFYAEEVAADEGNSGSGSSGKQAGAAESKKTTN